MNSTAMFTKTGATLPKPRIPSESIVFFAFFVVKAKPVRP